MAKKQEKDIVTIICYGQVELIYSANHVINL